MREFVIFSIILIVFLSGCTARVIDTGTTQNNTSSITESNRSETIPKPQVTATKTTAQETKVTTTTTTEVTEAPESPTETHEPRTFQIEVVQGMGIREGAG